MPPIRSPTITFKGTLIIKRIRLGKEEGLKPRLEIARNVVIGTGGLHDFRFDLEQSAHPQPGG